MGIGIGGFTPPITNFAAKKPGGDDNKPWEPPVKAPSLNETQARGRQQDRYANGQYNKMPETWVSRQR